MIYQITYTLSNTTRRARVPIYRITLSSTMIFLGCFNNQQDRISPRKWIPPWKSYRRKMPLAKLLVWTMRSMLEKRISDWRRDVPCRIGCCWPSRLSWWPPSSQSVRISFHSSYACDESWCTVLAALQLGSKRHPEAFDKFVICQVPCYTEGEESLKRTINSLSSLNYDDKRRLIFIICDGNITGKDNDRSTPQIALDILGVNPKTQPEPLMFKSIGDGSKQLNYGKVYSGLYEHEGHVVPCVPSFMKERELMIDMW